MEWRAKKCWIGLFGLALVVTLSSGCATLPNVSPFAEATVELRSAVITSGTAVEAELRENPVELREDRDLAEKLSKRADVFAKEWAVRVRAMDALVKYSESLVAIVEAGKGGEQSARAVADSVSNLAGALGIVIPAAGAVSVGTDAAVFIYGQIANIRASKSLEEALVQAQPAIDHLVANLSKDLKQIDEILQAANELNTSATKTKFGDEYGYLNMLERERKKLYAKGPGVPADEARLLELDRLIASTKSWREAPEKAVEDAEKRLKAGRQLIGATRQALTEWVGTHRSFVIVVKDRGTVNVQALVYATTQIRDLVRRIREL
jgi:hypothetical protein